MIESANTRLSALDFGRDIERLTQDFTGREWVFREIDKWLESKDERFFILTGEPGVGKSAIAARLTQLREDIVAHHFCIAGRNATTTPGSVLRSLGAQLGEALPGYGKALANTIKPEHLTVNVDIKVEKMTGGEITGVVINHLNASDPQEVFDILLRTPLAELEPPPEPIFILIDSLDEAVTYTGKANLVTLLAGAGDLPSWVRFLCTSRPERSRVLSYFDDLKPHVLAAESQMNQDDVHQYIINRVKREPMQAQLQSSNTLSQELVDRMRKLSKGNFLYTKILIDDIEDGRQPLDDLDALPRSLDEIYHGFLRRFTPSEWEARYQPILGVLVVAQEALTETQLANFTGFAETQMRQNLGVLLQFLDVIENEDEETYEIYHQSLRDYLLDKKRSKDFLCAAADGHRAIADFYLRNHKDKWSECDLYGLLHLPVHLLEVKQFEKLRQILFSFNWLQVKIDAAGFQNLISDYELLPEDKNYELLKQTLKLSEYALIKDTKQLAGHLYGRLMANKSDLILNLLNQIRKWKDINWFCPLRPSLTPPGGAMLINLEGHHSGVTSVAMTSDGRRAVSGAEDGSIIVWDLKRGHAIYRLNRLKGHLDSEYPLCKILKVVISADDKYAFSAASDGKFITWVLESGEVLHTFRMQHDFVLASIAVAQNSFRAISTSADNNIKVWDLLNGKLLYTYLCDRDLTSAVEITANGRLAIYGSRDTLKIRDIETGETLLSVKDPRTPKAILSAFESIAVTPDGRRGITIYQGNKIHLWDLENGRVLRVFRDKGDSYTAITITANGKYAISGTWEGTLKVWNLEKSEKVAAIKCHGAKISSFAVTPDLRLAITGSLDRTIRLWDFKSICSLGYSSIHDTEIVDLIITPDGNRIVTATNKKTINIWELEELERPKILKRINTIAITHNGRRAISKEARGRNLKVIDIDTGRTLQILKSHQGNIRSVAITLDDSRVISASSDKTLKVWEIDSGKLLHTLEGHKKAVEFVAVTPDGRRAISSSLLEKIRLWDIESGEEIINLPAKEYNSNTVAFTPDSRCAVLVGGKNLHLLDLESGGLLSTFKSHADGWIKIVVTPDGESIVIGWSQGRVNLLELKNGKLLWTSRCHDDSVCIVSIATNSNRALTGSFDKSLKLLDLRTGKIICGFDFESYPRYSAFGPDEKMIFVGDAAGQLHVLRLMEQNTKTSGALGGET